MYQRKYVYPLGILDQQYLVACCILLSKLLAQVVCFAEKVYVICLMGRLGRAIFTVNAIFAQISQEGIKCTKAKLLLCDVDTVPACIFLSSNVSQEGHIYQLHLVQSSLV